MAKGAASTFLILDACVVIDYADTDASVLGTVSAHVAPLALARPVLDEVDQLDERDALDLGITVVDIELRKVLVRAGAVRFEGPGGKEMWGLLERNSEKLSKSQD